MAICLWMIYLRYFLFLGHTRILYWLHQWGPRSSQRVNYWSVPRPLSGVRIVVCAVVVELGVLCAHLWWSAECGARTCGGVRSVVCALVKEWGVLCAHLWCNAECGARTCGGVLSVVWALAMCILVGEYGVLCAHLWCAGYCVPTFRVRKVVCALIVECGVLCAHLSVMWAFVLECEVLCAQLRWSAEFVWAFVVQCGVSGAFLVQFSQAFMCSLCSLSSSVCAVFPLQYLTMAVVGLVKPLKRVRVEHSLLQVFSTLPSGTARGRSP